MNRLSRNALFPTIIIAALVWLAVQTLSGDSNGSKKKLRFSDALILARQNPKAIESVTFHPSTQGVDIRLTAGTTRTTAYPVDQSAYELQQVLEKNGIPFDTKRRGSSAWYSILTSALPFVLLFGFWIFLMRMVKSKSPTEQAPPETPSRY